MNLGNKSNRPKWRHVLNRGTAGPAAMYPCPPDSPFAALGEQRWQSIGKTLSLSGRELEIARGLLDGLDEQAIALKLGIKRPTVHTYVGRMYRKLGIHSHCELAVYVMNACLSLSMNPPPP